jgi:hypothetical protein
MIVNIASIDSLLCLVYEIYNLPTVLGHSIMSFHVGLTGFTRLNLHVKSSQSINPSFQVRLLSSPRFPARVSRGLRSRLTG